MSKTITTTELEARGWTRALCTLYLTKRNGRYCREDAEIAEKTDTWRQDAARAAEGCSVSYSSSDLRERGWSRSMIKELLPEPDQIIKLNTAGTRVFHLYRAERAEKIEVDPAFTGRAAKAARRSTVASEIAERRANEVHELATVMAGKILISDPPENWESLVALALGHQQERYDSRRVAGTVHEADDATVERWCRNYLRHACSNYDAMLDDIQTRFSGVPDVTTIYDDVIRPRIDALVDTLIAELQQP